MISFRQRVTSGCIKLIQQSTQYSIRMFFVHLYYSSPCQNVGVVLNIEYFLSPTQSDFQSFSVPVGSSLLHDFITRTLVIILHKKLSHSLPAGSPGLALCPMYQVASQASNNCQFSLNTPDDGSTQVFSVTFMTRRQNVSNVCSSELAA